MCRDGNNTHTNEIGGICMNQNTINTNEKMLARIRAAHGITKTADDSMMSRIMEIIKKAAKQKGLDLPSNVAEQVRDFLCSDEVANITGNKYILTFVPTGSKFLLTNYGEKSFSGENGITAVLRKNRKGVLMLNLCHPELDSMLAPESSNEETQKADLTTKVKKAFEQAGIGVEGHEKALETCVKLLESAQLERARIHIWPEEHEFLNVGTDSTETLCHGEAGSFVVARDDMEGRRVANVCIPALTNELREKAYALVLRNAFADMIISIKGLQVRGNKVNTTLSAEKEIETDRLYLQKVLERIMISSVTKRIVEVISHHTNYSDIYTTSVVYRKTETGGTEPIFLFITDDVMHSEKMAQAFSEQETCTDLLQGDLPKLPCFGKTYAAIDPDQASLYLSKGKKGWRPNLYIPEGMFEEFLAVDC